MPGGGAVGSPFFFAQRARLADEPGRKHKLVANDRKVPPGPRGGVIVGNAIEFAENPLDFLSMCSRKYGDLVRIAKRTYLVNHPDLIQQVFHNKDGIFEKNDPIDKRNNHSAFPSSVMSSSGSDWETKRGQLQPAFHKALIRGSVDQAAAITRAFLNAWHREPRTRDMRQEMQSLCMEIGSSFLFDSAADQGETRRVVHMVDAIMNLTRSQIRFPSCIPTPGNLRLRRARLGLDTTMEGMVERYRKSSSNDSCLLGVLLAQDESGKSAWLRDELATMIMSGLEPMADALTWTFYLLALQIDSTQRIFREIGVIVSARGSISPDDLPKLPFTEAAIKEALRLYPPAWMTGRIAARDCVLGGFHVPAGTTLAISQWVTQRDPRYFEDPDEYRPSRWLDGGFLAALPRYAYFPFGGGLRKCIGAYLTMTEMVVVVALAVHAFEMKLAPDAKVTPFPALVLRPRGVRLFVTPRRSM